MRYKVTLLNLKCLVSQEDDGDEVYITLNGKKVWSVQGDCVMHQRPHKPHQMKEIDFAAGRYLSPDGWQPLPDFDPASVVFRGLTGAGNFQVWDHDNFSRDDFFGKILFSENEAGHGHINGVAASDAAHYVVIFEVVAEP
jgi:hypothetical protein